MQPWCPNEGLRAKTICIQANTKHFYNIDRMMDHVGPTLNKCYTNVLCLLGCIFVVHCISFSVFIFDHPLPLHMFISDKK